MRLDRLYTDIWRIGLVAAPIEAALSPVDYARAAVQWLPLRGPVAYAADPFGYVHNGALTVFAEHFDHSARHGAIAAYQFDAAHTLIETREVLREPWHISYPQVFADAGRILMLPEASAAGKLTLYEAEEFPWRWRACATLLDFAAVDATLFQHCGLWWVAFSPPGRASIRELRLNYAEKLEGPWLPHALNPVLVDYARARPGGQAFTTADGRLILPCQDCRATYGGALVLSNVTSLTPDRFTSAAIARLTPQLWPGAYQGGLHHLSAAGPSHSLIDVKRRHFTPVSGALLLARQAMG
jgi:hypothetical protein